jgi:DNA polymerase III subunit delta
VITTLTGENDVLRQNALRQLLDAFAREFTDMAVERLDGEDVSYDRMHEAVQSLPFLVSRKLVVLHRPSANKQFIERYEEFVSDVAETNDVVLVEPKLDKRLSYYKQLKKITDFQDFALLDSIGLVRYLAEYAREQGGSLGKPEARLLMDRVGSNQLFLQHEIDKLLAYNPKVTRKTIELLTERTPQSSIFELLEAAFAGNTQRAMQLYDEQREMRVEPQQIIAMIVWQLYILATVKTAGNRMADGIAKEAHLSPYTVRKSMELARHISIARLRALVSELRDFDTRLKSVGLNADEVVRYYLLALGREPQ